MILQTLKLHARKNRSLVINSPVKLIHVTKLETVSQRWIRQNSGYLFCSFSTGALDSVCLITRPRQHFNLQIYQTVQYLQKGEGIFFFPNSSVYLPHDLDSAAHHFPMKNYCGGKFLVICSETTFSIPLISLILPYRYVYVTLVSCSLSRSLFSLCWNKLSHTLPTHEGSLLLCQEIYCIT